MNILQNFLLFVLATLAAFHVMSSGVPPTSLGLSKATTPEHFWSSVASCTLFASQRILGMVNPQNQRLSMVDELECKTANCPIITDSKPVEQFTVETSYGPEGCTACFGVGGEYCNFNQVALNSKEDFHSGTAAPRRSTVTKNKDADCARKPLLLTNILCPIMFASLLAGLVYMLTYFDNIEIKGLNIKLDRGTRRKHVILVCRPGRFSFIVANEKIVPKQYPFIEFDF